MDDVYKKFKKIKFLVLDFDGVLTDNRVLVFEDGKEAVFCNRSDGFGIEMLQKAGIEVIVISKEKNGVVLERCKKLGIECQSGIENKIDIFLKEVSKRGLEKEEVCFMGNDINDIECIKVAGIGVAVADAYPSVLKAARHITKNLGGSGAVREIADIILNKND